MILPHLVINWIPAIATGHSHTSVGSGNNLHSFATAAATAAAAAEAADAQCIKVLLHETLQQRLIYDQVHTSSHTFTHIQCIPQPQQQKLLHANRIKMLLHKHCSSSSSCSNAHMPASWKLQSIKCTFADNAILAGE